MDINEMTNLERFLYGSNLIENERSEEAFEDAKVAWAYTKANQKLNILNILEIHRLLLKRLNPRIAGKFRDCDVWIGGSRKLFVSEKLIIEQIEEVLRQLNTLKNANASDARRLHVFFENIHPFEDGNGRIGRIILLWFRLKHGLSIGIIYAKNRYEYYKWFE